MDYYTGIEEIDGAIRERVGILSPTVRQLLAGEAVPTLAAEMAKAYNLTDEMQSGIVIETTLILVYLEPVEDFAENLMVEHLIPPEVAAQIARDMEKSLFDSLTDELGHVTEDTPLSAQETGVVTTTFGSAIPRATPETVVPQSPKSLPVNLMPKGFESQNTPSAIRTMPRSPEETSATHTSVELPGALLQNLKASLAHGTDDLPPEALGPTPSYNALLGTTPKPPVP